MNARATLAALAVLALAGCSDSGPHNRGVYMLLDTSGTYSQELTRAQAIINYALSELAPGDSFAVASIDTGSFSEKNIISKVTFENRPSVANQQKRQFREAIDRFVAEVKPSSYTDITGGVLQAVEYLNEKGTGKRTVLIFSDLKEDLKEGFVRDVPLELDGFEVVALNVTKLRTDNVDPREYMDRLAHWRQRVESAGGRWRVINDLEHIEAIFLD